MKIIIPMPQSLKLCAVCDPRLGKFPTEDRTSVGG